MSVPSPSVLPRSPWRMLGVAIVLVMATGPGQTIGVSVFVDRFIEDLHLTRSEVATAYLIGTLGGALLLPYLGRLIDRLGVRVMALGVISAFVVVLCGMSAVTGIVTLTIGFIGIRGLGQGSLSLIAGTTVAVWFERRRGTAMGLLAALGGAGMALTPLLGSVLISAWGWRQAWLGLAGVVALMALPLAVFVLRDPRIEGIPLEDSLAGSDDQPSGAQSIWTTKEILRHRAFWAVLLASATAGMLSTALVFHQIDLLGARGLSEGQAAVVFLPQALTGIASALVVGRMLDRIAPRHLLVVALLFLALPCLIWFFVTPGITAVMYGAAIGLGGGSLRTIVGVALPKWYGTVAIGEIGGIVQTSTVAASAVGPVALSLGLGVTGSYGAALLVLAGVPVLLGLFAISIHPPQKIAIAEADESAIV